MLCVTKRALCTAVKASQLPGDPFHTDRRDMISSKNSCEHQSCECMDTMPRNELLCQLLCIFISDHKDFLQLWLVVWYVFESQFSLSLKFLEMIVKVETILKRNLHLITFSEGDGIKSRLKVTVSRSQKKIVKPWLLPKTNLSVCFLGEVTTRQFCFKIYWPLSSWIFFTLSKNVRLSKTRNTRFAGSKVLWARIVYAAVTSVALKIITFYPEVVAQIWLDLSWGFWGCWATFNKNIFQQIDSFMPFPASEGYFWSRAASMRS